MNIIECTKLRAEILEARMTLVAMGSLPSWVYQYGVVKFSRLRIVLGYEVAGMAKLNYAFFNN